MSSKKSIYIKKKIDYDIPKNIMTMILSWIDCHNATIKETTEIGIEFEVDEKLNDTSIGTSMMKMSGSCKKNSKEMFNLENDIFNWICSFKNDKDIDFYCNKICNLMGFDKNHIIKKYVNSYRLSNKMKPFDPNYNKKNEVIKEVIKEENKEVKKDTKNEEKKNGKVVYGDAWDLL